MTELEPIRLNESDTKFFSVISHKGGPINEELRSLLEKEDDNDIENLGQSPSNTIQNLHNRNYGSTINSGTSTTMTTKSTLTSRPPSETNNAKKVLGFDFLQPTTFPKR